MIPKTENPQKAKMSVRVSLRGMLRLIRIDTSRRVHNVGFLAGRLKCFYNHSATDDFEIYWQIYENAIHRNERIIIDLKTF